MTRGSSIRHALAVSMALSTAAVGQTVRAPQVTLGGGFTAPIYDGARLIAVVSGKEAKPSLLAGQMIINEFRLETFRYNPDQQTELIIESPSGVFDGKGADSDQTLQLRGADGRFSVAGEGWSWRQAEGHLVVSNKAQTTLRRPEAPTNAPPVEVTANRLEYNTRTGDTRFMGDCVAEERGEARIRAEQLVTQLLSGAGRPQTISATGNVVIDLLRPGREGRAAAQAAEYTASGGDEQIQLAGGPTWRLANTEGTAERVILFPRREAYTAEGDARVTLPGRNPDDPDDRIDIACDRIEAEPGKATFSGHVRARKGDGSIQLAAGKLVALTGGGLVAAAGGEGLRQVTATEDVTARLTLSGGPVALRGDEMMYTVGEHPMIVVSGNPSWEAESHAGRAERFIIHPDGPAFEASTAVEARWAAGAGAGGDSAPMELRSRRMVVRQGSAQFEGGVVMGGENWTIEAPAAEAELAEEGVIENLRATGGIVLEYVAAARTLEDGDDARLPGALGEAFRDADEAGRTWVVRADTMDASLGASGALDSLEAGDAVTVEHPAMRASGGRLQYAAEDGLLRLVESPVLETADGLRILGKQETQFALDPEAGRFLVKGPVTRMFLPARAFSDADGDGGTD